MEIKRGTLVIARNIVIAQTVRQGGCEVQAEVDLLGIVEYVGGDFPAEAGVRLQFHGSGHKRKEDLIPLIQLSDEELSVGINELVCNMEELVRKHLIEILISIAHLAAKAPLALEKALTVFQENARWIGTIR